MEAIGFKLALNTDKLPTTTLDSNFNWEWIN